MTEVDAPQTRAARGTEPADERAYNALLSAIHLGEISPNERLVENTLVERYGLSRGAVRTALIRLEQDRVVVREPNRGAQVRHVSEREALEILEAQAALEGVAARRAAERATPEDIEHLRAISQEMRMYYEAGDLRAMSERNGRFHRYLIELSGSETIQQMTGALRSHISRFHYQTIVMRGRPNESLAEHRAIFEAVAAGDGAAAAAAMGAHVANVSQSLQALLGTRPDDP